MNEIDLDSLSNFWFVVSPDLNVIQSSSVFQKNPFLEKNLLEKTKFIQPKLNKDRDLFIQVKSTVIHFSHNDFKFNFRATAHRYGNNILFLCWPFLTEIKQIKEHDLGPLMSHPACLITDVLILKDVLFKQQDKIRHLEIEKVEKRLADQVKINRHQSKLASIGVLAAGVGHEINNPLAIISGNLSILQMHLNSQNLMDSEISERIKKAEKAIGRISNIVKGLRSLSRTDETGFKNFDFSDLVLETSDMIKDIFEREGIKLIVHVEGHLWSFGSRGRLQQVLVNLLNNAKDALDKSQIKEIHLSCQLIQHKIKISIHDTGSGIPEDIREKIFEPFFTTKEVNKGTGIGLALINSIVKEHGGEIVVESQMGAGSTFTIYLSSIDHTKLENQAPLIITEAPVQFNGTVLVVDDEDEILEILSHIFYTLGLEVITANNGIEAFTILSEGNKKIDLVVCDMKMPELDGPGLLQKMKSRLNFKGRFYFITGGVNVDFSTTEGIVDGIFTKPFKKDVITKELAQFLISKN